MSKAVPKSLSREELEAEVLRLRAARDETADDAVCPSAGSAGLRHHPGPLPFGPGQEAAQRLPAQARVASMAGILPLHVAI
jgi:hypothetical protein